MSRARFPVRRLPDGRALLNLGSSARVAPGWNNVDFSWLVRLARHPRTCALLHRLGLLNASRYERIRRLDEGTVCWDLRRGVPYPDRCFDAVYHSHVLEHLDREDAPFLVRECLRVLKPGALLRVVVPDLEVLARAYLDVVERRPQGQAMAEHTFAVEQMFDQMVVRTPRYRALERPLVRFAERLLIGDTAGAGVLHRWMYDRWSLSHLLREAGFSDVCVCEPSTSGIAGWSGFHLDTEPDGAAYLPFSLYVEARRALDEPRGAR